MSQDTAVADHATAPQRQEGTARSVANGHRSGTTSSAPEQAIALAFYGEAETCRGHRQSQQQTRAGDTTLGSNEHSSSQACTPGCSGSTSTGAAHGPHVDATLPLDFRIVTEPLGMQPASALYGVPYDLVDHSAGSALAELMRLTE